MRQFVAFLTATVAWALVARLLLALDLAHPLAIGAVWLVGFVWISGYIAAGADGADLLTKRWLQMLAGIGALAGIVTFAIS